MTARDRWDWFVRKQKYTWAALYLAAIPGFGFAYSYMERAFYVPNMRLEQSYSEDAEQVAGAICQLYDNMDKYKPLRLLTTNLIPNAITNYEDRANYASQADRVAANKFDCATPVAVSSGRVRALSVRASVRGETAASGGVHYPRIEVRMYKSGSASLSLYDNTFDTPSAAMVAPLDRKPVELKVAELQFGGPEEDQLLAQLWRFTEGDTGFTSDVSDNLQRMIYFSAVTITTLGFGDIVPVTTAARWLVMAEAVSGVVLIGLFLNSLAR
jgi:hypothetical protein